MLIKGGTKPVNSVNAPNPSSSTSLSNTLLAVRILSSASSSPDPSCANGWIPAPDYPAKESVGL